MGREKRKLPAAVVGGPKERHKRAARSQYDPNAPVPVGFTAKPAIPKTKHHSYFEFVANKDKKKKLEYEVTTKRTPPPGFEFVPIGDPLLTSACKELSREKDAMIFIVSNSKDHHGSEISLQVHRSGHHIREAIVEEARAVLDCRPTKKKKKKAGPLDVPEPIPESQIEYNAQVDAALRDLFPRIPNTDRQLITEHAFHRRVLANGDKPVGRVAELTLARRVQLAVLAHIRHTHTRYDELLRETTWQNARKVVEALCLDILVKWRGDEENGRDQLDEILREVVVISDSESEDSPGDTDESSFDDDGPLVLPPVAQGPPREIPVLRSFGNAVVSTVAPGTNPGLPTAASRRAAKAEVRAAEKKGQRGFQRYQAWQDAIRRHRDPHEPVRDAPMTRTPTRGAADLLGAGDRLSALNLDVNARPVMQRSLQTSGEILGKHARDPLPEGQDRQAFMDAVCPPGFGYPVRPRAQIGSVDRSREQIPDAGPSDRQPPSTDVPLQDFLVPSIEPRSPGTTQSSFVRTLPPRRHIMREPLAGFGSTPMAGSTLGRNDTMIARDADHHRRVVSDHHATGVPPTNRLYAEPHVSFPQNPPILHNGLDAPQPMLTSRHPHDEAVGQGQPPAKRIIVDAPRPGERSNPILMEDRGGFYERVPLGTEIHHRPQHGGTLGPGQGGTALSRFPGRNDAGPPRSEYREARPRLDATLGPHASHAEHVSWNSHRGVPSMQSAVPVEMVHAQRPPSPRQPIYVGEGRQLRSMTRRHVVAQPGHQELVPIGNEPYSTSNRPFQTYGDEHHSRNMHSQPQPPRGTIAQQPPEVIWID